jgi:hypothetical protein
MWQRLLPPLAGEGRDGGQRAHFHQWGRKMLPHVSAEAACGSVSFTRLRGKAGMGDSQH